MIKKLKSKNIQKSVKTFLKLPQSAQELIWSIASDYTTYRWFLENYYVDEADLEELSSAELVFKIAFDFYCFQKSEPYMDQMDNPISILPVELIISQQGLKQKESIDINGKKYIIDFAFNVDEGELKARTKNARIIIECSEYDDSQQRQLAFLSAGYDVIHINDNQIYNNSIDCAKKVHALIESRLKENWRS